jgi:prophage regulatory protein
MRDENRDQMARQARASQDDVHDQRKNKMSDIKPPVKLLQFRDLKATRGIDFSRRYLYTLEAQKKFPRRVPMGEHRVAWVESEIDTYLAEKLAARVH